MAFKNRHKMLMQPIEQRLGESGEEERGTNSVNLDEC